MDVGYNETDSNFTGNSSIPNPYYFYEREQFAVLGFLLCFIVLGNSAVIIALFHDKQRKSRMNFFIMQLALADLTVGLINVPTDLIWRITVAWHAGNFGCKFLKFLQGVVTFSSSYVLVALSIDRYDAIRHPMNFSGGSRRAKFLISAAWILSALFAIPMPLLYEETYVDPHVQCWAELEKWQWQLYMTMVFITVLLLPAIIISACYTVIVLTIWHKGRILLATPTSSRGLIPRAKIKTVKMTFVIVFVFILCWCPYIVFDLLQVYGYVPHNQNNIAIASFVQSLAPLNSAANPVICCFFSNHLRRNLIRLFPPMRRWLPPLDSRGSDHGKTESTLSATESIHLRRGISQKMIHVKLKGTAMNAMSAV